VSEATGHDSWFLHEKLILGLLSTQEAGELTRRMPGPSTPFAEAGRVVLFEEALAGLLARTDVAALDIEHLRGTLREGQLVWFEQAIPFKGISAGRAAIRRGENGRASFNAALATDKTFRVRGTYNAARITCSTAESELSGTSRQFVLGYVRNLTADDVELRPIVIASRYIRPAPEVDHWHPVDPGYVWAAAVDQFAGVDWSQNISVADLKVLKEIPEQKVKEAFAEILGEPVVPKDYGGEQLDLWTTNRFSVEGQLLRAAIAFKGPAKFHPMVIADLGKNGDQIDRLAHTTADILVVQHCHSIRAPVVNMLRVYASDPRNPRRYMTLDGFETIKILRHFGYLS
jgi:hypothetical protein